MTVVEFVNADNQAEMDIKFFNDYYAGKECYINNRRNKKGIVLGINKHLSDGINDPMPIKYTDRDVVNPGIVRRAEKIVFTVSFDLEESDLPKIVTFEIFMKLSSSSAVSKSAMSFRRPRKLAESLHY